MTRIALLTLTLLASIVCALPAFAAGDPDGANFAIDTDARTLAERAIRKIESAEEMTTKDEKLSTYREALELARRAVKANDQSADAHFAVFAARGRILLLEGVQLNPMNLMEANKELDRTLELNPNHADALASKGGLYRQLPWLLGGNLSKAETFLSRAIELNPDAVGARIELAETYRDMGHPERGVQLLEVAAQLAARQGRQQRLTQARELLAEFRTE